MNPIKEDKTELVKYIGLQEYPVAINKKPFLLVNNSMGSTIKYDPLKHEVSVKDLHLMEADAKKYMIKQTKNLILNRE